MMNEPKQQPEHQSFFILLVNDNPADIRILETLLENMNCSLVTASNGSEAMNIVQEEKPDLILLDMMMPLMDGCALVHQLKDTPQTKDIPVIILSEKPGPDNIIKWFNLGAVDYITKPVIEQELLARVKTHLTLKKMKEELAEEITTKNKFLSIISHDLRSSLSVILGFTGILQNSREIITVGETDELLMDIHHTATNTLELLENLLQWAKSQNNGIRFNPGKLDLESLISETLNTSAEMASGKNITLSSAVKPVTVTGDRNMLLLILRNLLSNAIKFTNDGGNVIVRASMVNGQVKVQVTDTGVGIAPDKLKKLFQIEGAVSTPGTRKEQGNGMGLILCREFILHHGGDIGIESYPGKGTTVWFTIPVDVKVPVEVQN
jgi:two-component system, sensor histidine kinase and response regulator